MMIYYKKFLIFLSAAVLLICFGFIKGAEAQTYYATGTLVSANLFSVASDVISSIDYFGYNCTTTATTTLKVQFSQNNTNWYSSTGTLDAWDNLSDGDYLATTTAIDLSALNWDGPYFYYKMQFETLDTSQTPILDEIRAHYAIGTTSTVVTATTTSIYVRTAVANGNVTEDGGGAISERGFEYGLTETSTWSVSEAGTFGEGSFSLNLTSLSPNTTYYVRAYAITPAGTSFGSWQSFTTLQITYYTTGTLVSTNLLSGQTVVSIDSFFASTTIPAGTSLGIQFATSSYAGPWYDDAGTLNSSTSLANGTSSTNLSGLGWSGANFYYKLLLYANTARDASPVVDEIQVDYTSNNSPDAPSSLGPSNYTDGSWGSDNTPALQFTQTDPNSGDTVQFRIQIDDSSDYGSAVVDYTSGLTATGSVSFTVGQATSTDNGTYAVGQEGQTLSESPYYWRVMSTDNIGATSSWTVATGTVAFGVDTSAPTSVSIVSITADSISQLTVTATATDSIAGLHATPFWFEETSNNSGSSSSTAWQASVDFVDSGLAVNARYIYKVKARNAASEESSYSATSSKYTLAPTPTNLAGSAGKATMALTVDSFSNNTVGSSGYYFYRSGDVSNSGWIQTNSWQDTELICDTFYTFYVKYRNGDETETNSISLPKSTLSCPGGGGGGGQTTRHSPPKAPEGGPQGLVVEGIKEKIAEILVLITQLKSQLQELLKSEVSNIPAAHKFTVDFQYDEENKDVIFLQIFLKSQGLEIYPEGIVSGWFGPLTKKAVIRFQEKYTLDILAPWKIAEGTGFVGSTTRTKINEILNR